MSTIDAMAPPTRLLLYGVVAVGLGGTLAYMRTPSAARSPVDGFRTDSSAAHDGSSLLRRPLRILSEDLYDGSDPMGRRFAGGRIITGVTRHRFILFTFDDGPHRRSTPTLLDRLDDEGVRGVFFLTASRLRPDTQAGRERAAIAQDIAARGHLIGSHTLDHAQLPLLSDLEVQAQLRGADRLFENLFGVAPGLFRPPGGARSSRVDELVAHAGYTMMMWNLGTGDTRVRDAQEVFATWRRVFARRERELGERGGIILLHDTHPWSVEAFSLIVAELLRRNCELLLQNEELFDLVDDPRWFYEAAQLGKRGRRRVALAGPATVDAHVLEARQRLLRDRTRDRCAHAF